MTPFFSVSFLTSSTLQNLTGELAARKHLIRLKSNNKKGHHIPTTKGEIKMAEYNIIANSRQTFLKWPVSAATTNTTCFFAGCSRGVPFLLFSILVINFFTS
jgi:hypothetical protein